MSIFNLISKGLTALNSVVSIAKDVNDLKNQPRQKVIEDFIDDVAKFAAPEEAPIIEEVKKIAKSKNKK